MFDDHITQGGGTVPQNLPIGEPEDIFSPVDPEDSVVQSKKEKFIEPARNVVASPVSSIKTALSAGVLKPKGEEIAVPASDMSEQVLRPSIMSENQEYIDINSGRAVPSRKSSQTHTLSTDVPEMYEVKAPKISKAIITGIIAIVVVLVLGGGGLFIYNQFILNSGNRIIAPIDYDSQNDTDIFGADADGVEKVDSTILTEEVIDDSIENGFENTTGSLFEKESDIFLSEPVDTDGDGLDDEREANLNTDPAHWDTDGDGLSDGDEVIIWKTDPLNPDSDADGFEDGAEIKNGYSPTGPGKIFELPVLESPETPI